MYVLTRPFKMDKRVSLLNICAGGFVCIISASTL